MNKNYIYVAVIQPSNDGKYFLFFHDIPGCTTCGDTLDELLENAKRVLSIHIKTSEEKNEILPEASTYAQVKSEHEKDMIQIISVNPLETVVRDVTTVKKTLSIPAWLNKLSIKYHINFSSVLKEALISQLKNQRNLTDIEKSELYFET
jgi:predicted RNase H-like HicB family nuclease